MFREQELHGEILAGISDDDLQSILGVRDPQERELLMAAIRQACGLNSLDPISYEARPSGSFQSCQLWAPFLLPVMGPFSQHLCQQRAPKTRVFGAGPAGARLAHGCHPPSLRSESPSIS